MKIGVFIVLNTYFLNMILVFKNQINLLKIFSVHSYLQHPLLARQDLFKVASSEK